jgi:ABC-type multidrug transport system fused ATPase/permease subunit
VEWSRATRSLLRAAAWADTTQWLVTLGAVGWMVQSYVSHTRETRGVLLLTYWGLYLQYLGEDIGGALRQLPGQRNTTLRLLEPLGAIEDLANEALSPRPVEPTGGVAIELRGVGVVAAGHTILEGLKVRIEPGEQVGIVGPSGAGKSSLVGLLLGWHRAAAGTVRLGRPPGAGVEPAAPRQPLVWRGSRRG